MLITRDGRVEGSSERVEYTNSNAQPDEFTYRRPDAARVDVDSQVRRVDRKIGEVAERSIAAGCKPAALVATEVRTLPSPPLSLKAHSLSGA